MTTQYIKKNRKPCGELQKGMLLNNDLPCLKFHQIDVHMLMLTSRSCIKICYEISTLITLHNLLIQVQ